MSEGLWFHGMLKNRRIPANDEIKPFYIQLCDRAGELLYSVDRLWWQTLNRRSQKSRTNGTCMLRLKWGLFSEDFSGRTLDTRDYPLKGLLVAAGVDGLFLSHLAEFV